MNDQPREDTHPPRTSRVARDVGEAVAEGGRGDGGAVTDEVLRALASPPRRAILRLVAQDELAAGAIAEAFDITRTAVSQHLTVLRNAGLLTERRDGTRRLYRARPQGLAALREFLDDMWAASLDAAALLVEADRGLDMHPGAGHEEGDRAG